MLTLSISVLLMRLKYQLARLPFLSYGRAWSLLSLTAGAARYGILNISDERTFNQQGEKDADKLKKYVNPNSIVLDLGCGIGRIDKYLAPFCKELLAADVSRMMLRRAKRRLKHRNNVFFHTLNGKDLGNFPDCKFDFVFSIAVFQHLKKEETYSYLMEIFRVLKPKGVAYRHFVNFLDEYNFASFAEYARNPWKRSKIMMRYHTVPEVEKMLERIRFNIDSIESNYSIVAVVFKPEIQIQGVSWCL